MKISLIWVCLLLANVNTTGQHAWEKNLCDIFHQTKERAFIFAPTGQFIHFLPLSMHVQTIQSQENAMKETVKIVSMVMPRWLGPSNVMCDNCSSHSSTRGGRLPFLRSCTWSWLGHLATFLLYQRVCTRNLLCALIEAKSVNRVSLIEVYL